MTFNSEDFGSVFQMRMGNKPNKPTLISLIFFRVDNTLDHIKVLAGIEPTMIPSKGKVGDEESVYTNLIQFEKKLLNEFKAEKIEIDDLLNDMAPLFCENPRFRKLIWDELHADEPIKRQRFMQGRHQSKQYLTAQKDYSPRDSKLKLIDYALEDDI